MQVKRYIIYLGIVFVILILNQLNLMAERAGVGYCYRYGSDLNQDGAVDFDDLKTLADKWIECSSH